MTVMGLAWESSERFFLLDIRSLEAAGCKEKSWGSPKSSTCLQLYDHGVVVNLADP